jgi:hypothetical protein
MMMQARVANLEEDVYNNHSLLKKVVNLHRQLNLYLLSNCAKFSFGSNLSFEETTSSHVISFFVSATSLPKRPVSVDSTPGGIPLYTRF